MKKQKKDLKKERIFCLVVLLFLIGLIILSFINYIFIPATLICAALELFCICYLFRDNKTKAKLTYLLFTLGIILLLIAIIYTIIKTT